MSFYQRNLPHFVPPGATLFITFRLEGSLPFTVLHRFLQEADEQIRRLHREIPQPVQRREALLNLHKRQFARLDAYLDTCQDGPHWLRQPAIAGIVADEMHRLSELAVQVWCFCVMSNHVHLVVQLPPQPNFSYPRMMQRLKGRTALAANRLLKRTGVFWQHESYDHLVQRSGELERVIAYTLDNPVRAGLVAEATKWPYSYVRPNW